MESPKAMQNIRIGIERPANDGRLVGRRLILGAQGKRSDNGRDNDGRKQPAQTHCDPLDLKKIGPDAALS